MKRFFAILACFILPLAAFSNEEEDLIGVLKSNDTPRHKDAACARLKRIGTARCVPALSELLPDPVLSHAARYALESLPGPEAEAALLQALPLTSGSNQVGIVTSLGVRGDKAAGLALARLLNNSEIETEIAAASTLGKLGGPEALAALEQAWKDGATGALHEAETDSLLAFANQYLTNGSKDRAEKLFRDVYTGEKDAGIRMTAFRGVMLSSGKRGVALMIDSIKGGGEVEQGAALELAAKMGGPGATRALAELLPNLSSPMQIALLQALQQRGDPAAAPETAKMLDSRDQEVRLAAMAALCDLGSGRVAPALAEIAAHAKGEEKTAARQALACLKHGSVTKEIVKELGTAPPPAQAELIIALGARGDSSVAPKLLEWARGASEATQAVALQALAAVATQREIPSMIQLVIDASGDDARSAAADALSSACQHIQAQHGKMDDAGLARAVRKSTPALQVVLLPVCSGVSGADIRKVLREEAGSTDAPVRTAAMRALCDSQDEQLLPDILKTATSTTQDNFRTLAIRGCVRLITQEGSTVPVGEKLNTLQALQNISLNAEGKRQVLAGLASIADIKALHLAASMLEDGEVEPEAADAVVLIAKSISAKHPKEASAALRRVLAMSVDASVHKSARDALKKMKPGA